MDNRRESYLQCRLATAGSREGCFYPRFVFSSRLCRSRGSWAGEQGPGTMVCGQLGSSEPHRSKPYASGAREGAAVPAQVGGRRRPCLSHCHPWGYSEGATSPESPR